MTTSLQMPHRLSAVLGQVRQATGVDIAFGGLVAEPRGTSVKIDSMVGSETDALRGLVIDQGRGLGGKALAIRRPVYVAEYHQAKGITHDYDKAVASERLQSVFAIPFLISGGQFGLVYGAFRGATPIGDRVVGQACSIVRRAQDLLRDDGARTEARREQDRKVDAESARMRQQLRDAHAELTLILNSVSQPDARERIKALLAKLADSADHDPASHPEDQHHTLAPRELDVLSLVAAGLPNSEIARDLYLSLPTVKAYLRSACRKLSARNRMEAVVFASRRGLLP